MYCEDAFLARNIAHTYAVRTVHTVGPANRNSGMPISCKKSSVPSLRGPLQAPLHSAEEGNNLMPGGSLRAAAAAVETVLSLLSGAATSELLAALAISVRR